MSDSWKTARLGSVATLQRGYDLPHRLRKAGPVPIVTSSGVEDMHYNAMVKGPGVVTGRYGTIGEVFFVHCDFWPLNTTLYVRDFHGNDPLFVSYLLRTIDFDSHSAKTGVPGVNRNDLHEIEVSIPPTTAEQRAIAAALRDMDSLIESVEQLIVKKCHLKEGAMQELLTGKKRLPGFNSLDVYNKTEVGLIPQDWRQVTIREIATKIGSGITPTGGNQRYKEYGRPFVRSQNVGWGKLLLKDLAFIDDDTHNQFCATELEENDVLLNITGASIGRSALADKTLVGGNVNQHVCIVRSETAIPKLINLLLLSALGQRQIQSFQAGGNRQGLNFAQIASIKLPLPSTKHEQKAVADVFSDMQAEIAALEAKLAKTRELKQGMMQELLTGRTRLV